MKRLNKNLKNLKKRTPLSLASHLLKLRWHFICHGKIPNKYLKLYDRYNKNPDGLIDLSIDKQQDFQLINTYIYEYGYPEYTKVKSKITHEQKIIGLAFLDFIDSPRTALGGKLNELYYCKHSLKSLQYRQRLTLAKVTLTLLSFCNVESFNIGTYDSQCEVDSRGYSLMRPIPNVDICRYFYTLWEEPILKDRFYNCTAMLKACGFYEITSCYYELFTNQVLKTEEFETLSKLEKQNYNHENEKQIRSVASYKHFTPKFLKLFSTIRERKDVKKSRRISIKNNHIFKRSPHYQRFTPLSYRQEGSSSLGRFWTKKRKAIATTLESILKLDLNVFIYKTTNYHSLFESIPTEADLFGYG